jgi:hypothetical protein
VHPMISHVPVPAMDPLHARALDPWSGPAEIITALDALCPRSSFSETPSTAATSEVRHLSTLGRD